MRQVQTQILEALEENLSTDVDPKEWNWQAMANTMNTRYSLKLTDRQLKQTGRDNLSTYLIGEAEKNITAVDLSAGEPYLKSDWGVRSACDWAKIKFQIQLETAQLEAQPASQIKEMLLGQIKALYRQKDIEYSIVSITGKDLVVTKENEKVVVSFAYDKEVELVKPVFLLIKFEGRSK